MWLETQNQSLFQYFYVHFRHVYMYGSQDISKRVHLAISTPAPIWTAKPQKVHGRTSKNLVKYSEKKSRSLLKFISLLLVIQFLRIVSPHHSCFSSLSKNSDFLCLLCVFSFFSYYDFFCQTNYWNKFTKEFVFPLSQLYLSLSGIGVTKHENCHSSDVCLFSSSRSPSLSQCHST